MVSVQIEGTIGMCYTYLLEISKETDDDDDGGSRPPKKKAPASKAKKWRDEPLFRALMTEIEMQRHPERGLPPHPKMDKLKALVIQHFAENMGDNDEVEGKRDETRVMVFTTFRESVGEIVDTLNLERPLIRATAFIGQGVDKQGKKGLAQKEQLAVRFIHLFLRVFSNLLNYSLYRSSRSSRPESSMYLWRRR